MFLALDCLKFYKLKSEVVARSLFVILYVFLVLFTAFPIGEQPDIQAILVLIQSGELKDFPSVTPANIYYALSFLGFSMLTAFFSVIYATCFIAEKDGFPARKGIIDSVRKIPSLIVFVLILIVPAMISAIFAFIPLIYLYYSLFVAAVLITEGKQSLFSAMSESFRYTKGYKLNIFFTQMVVYFAVNIPMSIFEALFIFQGQSESLAANLVLSFIRAARILITGRLIGNYYLILVKNRKDVLSVPVPDEGRYPDIRDNSDNSEEDVDEDKEDEH
ncbi:MAG: hypothetical protein WCR87_00325 [Saccharofermentanales bacterium]